MSFHLQVRKYSGLCPDDPSRQNLCLYASHRHDYVMVVNASLVTRWAVRTISKCSCPADMTIAIAAHQMRSAAGIMMTTALTRLNNLKGLFV
jgi:hypothetical protein